MFKLWVLLWVLLASSMGLAQTTSDDSEPNDGQEQTVVQTVPPPDSKAPPRPQGALDVTILSSTYDRDCQGGAKNGQFALFFQVTYETITPCLITHLSQISYTCTFQPTFFPGTFNFEPATVAGQSQCSYSDDDLKEQGIDLDTAITAANTWVFNAKVSASINDINAQLPHELPGKIETVDQLNGNKNPKVENPVTQPQTESAIKKQSDGGSSEGASPLPPDNDLSTCNNCMPLLGPNHFIKVLLQKKKYFGQGIYQIIIERFGDSDTSPFPTAQELKTLNDSSAGNFADTPEVTGYITYLTSPPDHHPEETGSRSPFTLKAVDNGGRIWLTR
jgi:hypothetical protein